ncbi:MAG: alpha-L-fucosidase [Gemmatimonadales bacterium]|nr:alpha-L-fucosidase [Gemmatimonadales bacterium]MDZ4388101.1 alpha-L-fucosidase [Gemmatimonadales bacterium]
MTSPTTRRSFLRATLAASAVAPFTVPHATAGVATGMFAPRRRPRPTTSQLVWQRDELAMFIHFGVNTFTDREWGDGSESPAIFNPAALDARQWARSARAAGFRALILTAKHHDGFCLWPTATTGHSVRSSPWRGGDGDVVREFVDACSAEGLRAGLYLSPWDRNAASYGDSPRYNDFYIAQLTELLTRYGAIHEVWFDGANGEGPNGKRQIYDWGRTWRTVKALQPEAVIFSDAGPDVRWIGNESGVAGETNWSTVDPSIVPVPGMTGDEVMRSLREGDREGTVWRPGETDVSIRPGWFHHAAEDDRVKSVDALLEIYLTSVGRNSKLLLNVPPTRTGLLHETDIARLTALRERRERIFAEDLAAGQRLEWTPMGETRAVGLMVLARTRQVGVIELREPIAEGQRVARHMVEGRIGGEWRELVRGTTIGYRRISAIAPVALEAVRVRVEDAVEEPRPVEVRVFGG